MMQFGGDIRLIKGFIEFGFKATKFVSVGDMPEVLNAQFFV